MKKMALCQGRHEIPDAVDGSIYEMNLNPLDLDYMSSRAREVLDGTKELILYVTGLTVALVSVINVCHELGIRLVLMHYDRESGDYYPQNVI